MSDLDPARLGRLLARAYRPGIALPTDLLDQPELLDLLAPGRPHGDGEHPVYRAQRAHRLIVSAVASLRSPHCDVLRALLDLEAPPAGRRITLNLTERRERAGTYFNVAGDTFRRHHEPRHTQALAAEIYSRLKAAADTARPAPPAAREGGDELTIPTREGVPRSAPPAASTFTPRPYA
ncbi:hypothetical protein MXD59_16520 [Frankia sp. Ag45/Mut15]|uniref:Uncharacterized protein n=1 Tax=Frankia umida TaxID=573489 RepID=A0ABT0K0P5_9ACTN|nr:hypothetical protein [Frankia umida]MCK9877354.1 hypothetical protein [Frankia umida]